MGHRHRQEKAIKENMDSAPCRKHLREPLTNGWTERRAFITQTNWHLWICSSEKKQKNLVRAIEWGFCEGVQMGDAEAFDANV